MLIAGLLSSTPVWPAPIRVVEVGPDFVRLAGSGHGPGARALVGIPVDSVPRLRIVETPRSGTSSPAPRLGAMGFFRKQRIVEILFPPAQDTLSSLTDSAAVVVEVSFPSASRPGPVARRGGYEEGMYRGSIINYEQARSWRLPRPVVADARTGAHRRSAASEVAFKITVQDEGIYRLTGEDLIAAGVPAGAAVASMGLYYGGGRPLPEAQSAPSPQLQPQRFLVEDGGDGRLDEDDALLFYGQATSRWIASTNLDTNLGTTSLSPRYLTNPFTDANVYWLRLDAEATAPPTRDGRPDGSASERRTTYTARLHEEVERAPLHVSPGNIASGKQWYWELLQRGDRRTLEVALPDAAAEAATLRVGLYGDAETEALVQVSWNAGAVATVPLRPDSFSVVERRVGAAGGDGRLGLTHISGTGAGFFDWYEVEYERHLSARESMLIFDGHTAGGGPKTTIEYNLSGFDERPRVFAVSEAGLIEIVGATYDATAGELSFQDTAAQRSRRYIAVTDSAATKPIIVEARFTGDLTMKPGGADYVVISHGDFLTSAQRLADWRSADDRFGQPPRTAVVDVAQIYDDFSGGLFDPTAIRNFLRHTQQAWTPAPGFVVFVGDGTYDYRNHSGTSSGNWIPPYEERESTYDEWYTRVSGDDAIADMAIGRLPVQTATEAQDVVQKLLDYDAKPEFGSWQGRVLLVADDTFNADEPLRVESMFTHDTEGLARLLPPALDAEKLYLVEFPFEGRFKPKARDAFVRRFNEGAVLLTWVGHGNATVFAHEHIFVLSTDLQSLDNGGRLPFVYAAASQVGVFDDPDQDSIPEALLKLRRGGAIGMIAATRIGFHSSNIELARNFHERMFGSGRAHVPTGLALLEAKLRTHINSENEQRYSLFGDPLTRLSVPTLGVTLQTADTLRALGVATVQGEVVDENGMLQSGFSGQARVHVFDSIVTRRQTWRGEPLQYDRPVAVLFRGVFPVVGGRFAGDFPVPKDITYRGERGRVSVYAWSDQASAFGAVDGLVLAGTADNATRDSDGPTIAIGFAGQPFLTGDFVSPRPRLQVTIEDPSGINATGEVGHQIMLTVDDRRTDVTALFETGADFRLGGLSLDLPQLEPGPHEIRVEAWDTHNNWSEQQVTAVVELVPEIDGPLFHPNPSRGPGYFTFVLSVPAEVSIGIYSVSGRRVDELRVDGRLGYNQVAWEAPPGVANGSFAYRISIRTSKATATAQGVIQISR